MGAKAGIGAGAAIGVIVILALAFFLIRYRRRLRQLEQCRSEQYFPVQGADGYSDKNLVSASQDGSRPSHGEPLMGGNAPPEVDGSLIHEMPGQDSRRR